jgi:phosphatidylglycerophosphatase A
MLRLALAVATCLGVGYAPTAPGTFGSLAGLALWWFLPSGIGIELSIIVVLFGVGAWSASAAERHFGNTDPGPVVIDEVMGMLITMFLVPKSVVAGVVGFLLFRAADILKPYPANRLESLHGGIGVMADDAMAAVYGNLALRCALVAVGWIAGTPRS